MIGVFLILETLGERMFTSLICLIRDSCHALRIAMKDPLQHDSLFGNIWTTLFDKKGAMVANFQHSEKMKCLLVAAQKEGARPVDLPANLRSPLTTVLQSFSFAKQRFDSTVDPCAKLCLLLLPAVTVNAFIASDTRVKPELRERAKASVKFMTSQNAIGLGLFADWGIAWESFLRLFDKGDHDIAGSSEEIEGLIHTLQKLFVEGAVFHNKIWHDPLHQVSAIGEKLLPPVVSHNMKAAGLDGQFINAIVTKQLQHKCVFNVGGEPVVIWGALPPSEKTELAHRIQNVAKLGIGRLQADFPRSDMRFFLRAFHMPLVQAAFKPPGNEPEQDALTRCCNAALENMSLPDSDLAPALLEYKVLAKLVTRLSQPGQPLATKTNREIWGNCLDPLFLRKHLPNTVFIHIPRFIRYYESILDGSCGVERGLAKVRAVITSGNCKNIRVLDDLAVFLDNDLEPWDVALEQHGSWEPGPFGFECGVLWREVLGARLGIYNKAHNNTKRNPKPGTYKNVKAGVLKAIGATITSRKPLASQGALTLAQALSTRYGPSAAGTTQSPYWNKGFTYITYIISFM